MKRLIILLAIASLLVLVSCRETSENEQYYYRGLKAEQNLRYSEAIEHYAKSLTFNRQDAVSWNAKGRCHLLLAMSTYVLESPSNVREVRIKGNLGKAQDCFRRAEQWGFRNSAETDSLKVSLDRIFNYENIE